MPRDTRRYSNVERQLTKNKPFEMPLMPCPPSGKSGNRLSLRKYFSPVLSTFDRYTDEAKRAIFFGRLEANHCDGDSITPDHILAGLMWESDSTLAGVASLKELTVELRAQMELPHLPSTSFRYLRDRATPLNEGGKKALAYAVAEANRDWRYWIDCDHLAGC